MSENNYSQDDENYVLGIVAVTFVLLLAGFVAGVVVAGW